MDWTSQTTMAELSVQLPRGGDWVTAVNRITRHGSDGGTETILAEPTAARGLVILPHRAAHIPMWSGRWSLVHSRSGSVVNDRTQDIPVMFAREAGHCFAALGGDWTRTAEEITADPAARAIAHGVGIRLGAAQRQEIPMWWHRPSWIDNTTAGAELVCGAPMCGWPHLSGPATLADFDFDYHCQINGIRPGRSDATAYARAHRWRLHGDHALCPDCATAHATS